MQTYCKDKTVFLDVTDERKIALISALNNVIDNIYGRGKPMSVIYERIAVDAMNCKTIELSGRQIDAVKSALSQSSAISNPMTAETQKLMLAEIDYAEEHPKSNLSYDV
jgi:hypothetical protein